MPIANCFVKEKQIAQEDIQDLAEKWASEVNIDVKDICVTFIPDCIQVGQQYKALVHLYLPSLWSEDQVHHIQKSLLRILCEFLKVEASEVFIMTSIILSGHVVENGEVVKW